MTGALVSRRAVLATLGGGALLGALGGCSSTYPRLHLSVATGTYRLPYDSLGRALATAWGQALGMPTPTVIPTHGSIDNLRLLADRTVDIAFNQIDTAIDHLAHTALADPYAIRALARIYDDVVHVVVPKDSSITNMRGLRGTRVALGSEGSGVQFVARRVLQILGLSPDRDIRPVLLGIDEEAAALRAGRIDAFFWSGGLPTRQVDDLADLPIRLLDLEDDLPTIHGAYPEYAAGTIPRGTYGQAKSVTTLLMRNLLLVRKDMADGIAHDLVATLMTQQETIAQNSPNVLGINVRAAIGTQLVPLHPGAVQWFRENRGI